jgi:hypothetical protein
LNLNLPSFTIFTQIYLMVNESLLIVFNHFQQRALYLTHLRWRRLKAIPIICHVWSVKKTRCLCLRFLDGLVLFCILSTLIAIHKDKDLL